MGVGMGVGEVGVAMLDTPTGVACVDSTVGVSSTLSTSVVVGAMEVLSVSEDGGTTVWVELTAADGDTLSGRLRVVVLASEDDSTV